MNATIVVPEGEILHVAYQMRELLDPDESCSQGHLRLTARGHRRRWYATDGLVAAIDEMPHAGPDLDVLLSPRLLPHLVEGCGDVHLTIPTLRRDGTFDGPAVLAVDSLEVVQPVRFPSYPDFDGILGDALALEAAVASVERYELQRLVHVIRRRPAGSDEQLNPPAFLSIDGHSVAMRADWPGWGESQAVLNPVTTQGRASASVSPNRLWRLLQAAPEDLELRVPATRGELVVISGGGFHGLLKPHAWPDATALLADVQEILDEALGMGRIEPDHDGDLPVPFEDARVFIRTVDGTPAAVQLFTVLAEANQPDPALLGRINDFNASLRGCRMFWTAGQVLLETDISADALSPEQLRTALNTVTDATRLVRHLFELPELSPP